MRSLPFVHWSDRPRIIKIVDGNLGRFCLENPFLSLFVLLLKFVLEMVENGFVLKEEPNKKSKKRTAHQAKLDTVSSIEIQPKRTRRQEAIHLAALNEKQN